VALHLLDADAVIDLLYDVPLSVALVRSLFDQRDALCTYDVVVAEVFSGLREEHEAAAEQLFGSLAYLPTTMAAARQAGAWRRQYLRQGRTYATTDCLIAVAHRASLVTGNFRDFPYVRADDRPAAAPGRRSGPWALPQRAHSSWVRD
jgi:predicted nucleic acid-binding protein